jgi:hypothetical protein
MPIASEILRIRNHARFRIDNETISIGSLSALLTFSWLSSAVKKIALGWVTSKRPELGNEEAHHSCLICIGDNVDGGSPSTAFLEETWKLGDLEEIR